MKKSELRGHFADFSQRELYYREHPSHELSSFFRFLDQMNLKDENNIYILPRETLDGSLGYPPDDKDYFWNQLKGSHSRFLIKKATRFYREPFMKADFTAIRYVYSGQCLLHTGTEDLILHENDMIMVNPGFVMSQELGEKDHVFTMMLDRDYVRNHLLKNIRDANDITWFFNDYVSNEKGGQRSIIFHGGQDERIREVIESILCEQIDPSRYGDVLMDSYLRILLTYLLETPHSYQRTMHTHPEKITGILNYISEHYRDVTLQDLADHFGYSAKYISQMFHVRTGKSFKEYVTALRMEEVSFQLRNSTHSVESIMHQSGFTNETYFYHQFQKIYGMTPAAYRRKDQTTA